MALQIKGKFIQSEAIDGSKLKLKQGEALRAVDENGVDIELLKIGVNGEIIANGAVLALQVSLDAEVSRASSAEATLQSNIEAEAAARAAAVSSEASTRAAADSVLQSNIDAEAAARASAISTEQAARAAAVAAEQARAEAAEAALQSAIEDEEAARIAAVSAEAASRSSADSALSGRLDVIEGAGEGSVAKAEADAKAYADQKVADLVASAPEVLDTLKELSDAIGGDENFAATVAGQVGTVQSNLDAEEARALAAESSLSSAISAEETARIAAVSAEETRALAAEAALSSSISAEVSARQAAVSAEQTAREAADASLQAALDQEILDRAADVDAEESRALAAEAVLQAAITALEQSVGESLADQVEALESALADEEAARIAADSAESAARAAADSALQSELDAEEARAAAAEAAIAADLVTEETRALAAEAALQAAIDAEVAARASAVSSEAAARAAADSTLQDNIDAEEAARIAGDAATLASANSYTDSQVAALVNSAPEVLDTLKELSDALGGDENFAVTVSGQIGTVQSNLDAEEARALAAEAVLTAAVSAEESARIAADALKVDKAGDTITGEMVFDNADLKVKNPSGQVVAHFDASESSAVFGYASPDNLTTELAGGAIKVEAGVNLGGAQTFVGAGFINLQESDGSAALPTLAKHAANKAYVDQEVAAEAAARGAVDSAHNTRISALEAKAFYKYSRQLTSTDIANGYLNLPHLIEDKSSVVAVGRLMAHEGAGYDYSVSTVGSVSRITFLNSLLPGGEEALAVGDYVFVQYRA